MALSRWASTRETIRLESQVMTSRTRTDDRSRLDRVTEFPDQRRTLAVLVGAQILAGAGLSAGITVGGLLAQGMLGSTALAGLPSALFTAGAAAAAGAIGYLTQRFGRRAGLASGYAVGATGSAGVVLAAQLDNPVLLVISLLLYGAGTAANLQARYAGTDLAAPARRGRAISTVLVATTVGGVTGPNLVAPTGAIATRLGFPPLTGPFLLAAAAYGASAFLLHVCLRPDPLVLARSTGGSAGNAVSSGAPPGGPAQEHTTTAERARNSARRLRAAAVVLITTQMIMVAIMTMTPIHMVAHGHGVGATGVVIGVHVAAMYLPSPLTGRLVDRFGPLWTARLASLALLTAGLLAAFAPVTSVGLLAGALALLGLGWNLGLVSGTTVVAGSAAPSTRARVQGLIDAGVAISGAGGGLASGMVVAGAGYVALSLLGGFVALVVLGVLAFRRPF